VLVVLDGVRWQEIWNGVDPELIGGRARIGPDRLTPNLHELATTTGAGIGSISASGPAYVSLPGYTEIFTGRASRCHDNDCPPIREQTIADELAARGEDVAVFSSWERIANAAASNVRRIALSTGRSIAYGVDDDLLAPGRHAGPYPGSGDFRPDRFTARAALAHLERHRPSFLFVGLGEPDELAHMDDYEGYLASLHTCDAVVGEIRATLARMGERGAKTSLFVTTDHGRARRFKTHGEAWPESGRVWLVASGAGVVARGSLDTKTHVLADVAPTLRVLLGLAPPSARTGDGRAIEELLAAR
jgi:hypothetical protein